MQPHFICVKDRSWTMAVSIKIDTGARLTNMTL